MTDAPVRIERAIGDHPLPETYSRLLADVEITSRTNLRTTSHTDRLTSIASLNFDTANIYARETTTREPLTSARDEFRSLLTGLDNDTRRSIETGMRNLGELNRTPPLTSEQTRHVFDIASDILRDSENRSPLSIQQRALAVAGLFHNVSAPSSIEQGEHPTCNVTTLEERLYTRDPVRAAEIVRDVALTGGFSSSGGFRAVLDRESLVGP